MSRCRKERAREEKIRRRKKGEVGLLLRNSWELIKGKGIFTIESCTRAEDYYY